jgi:hypothetical protein
MLGEQVCGPGPGYRNSAYMTDVQMILEKQGHNLDSVNPNIRSFFSR